MRRGWFLSSGPAEERGGSDIFVRTIQKRRTSKLRWNRLSVMTPTQIHRVWCLFFEYPLGDNPGAERIIPEECKDLDNSYFIGPISGGTPVPSLPQGRGALSAKMELATAKLNKSPSKPSESHRYNRQSERVEIKNMYAYRIQC